MKKSYKVTSTVQIKAKKYFQDIGLNNGEWCWHFVVSEKFETARERAVARPPAVQPPAPTNQLLRANAPLETIKTKLGYDKQHSVCSDTKDCTSKHQFVCLR